MIVHNFNPSDFLENENWVFLLNLAKISNLIPAKIVSYYGM